MQTSSLRKNKLHLESVLGPLSDQDDQCVRALLDEVAEVLLQIAGHFGHDEARCDGVGFELASYASGQVAIRGHVGACIDSSRCVAFCIELRPSWYFGQRSSTAAWEVITEIEADCDAHAHGMHAVHHSSTRADRVFEAVVLLRVAVQDLLRHATEVPLSHWLKLATDHAFDETR
ncbi:hypothetical protein [Humisphaera borealis]|uniref:Uncharacterized protein n=1 Tax=Humisphaera borealis TaxID=2807512 RepID=A0A7M2WSN0_9BACT|nr:hypothetical protein [Humisphaera borealis]QOV88507.1 hypothetical protein IPV69_20010 [Humisphaera borealis]